MAKIRTAAKRLNKVGDVTRQALYYPYMHIEDVNWLKATLLVFDSVSRMLPPEYQWGLNDDDRVRDFQESGLLNRANLFSTRSIAAQSVLEQRFRASAKDPEFRRRYGQREAEKLLTPRDPFGFQIHRDKSTFPLRDSLLALGLAWGPRASEPYDSEHGYLQMHPRVGQVVMATIAIASAQADGLDIVGDARSGALHQVLLERDLDSIYDAWLGTTMPAPPAPASEERVFEFLIATSADVSQVTPEALKALDREPLNALLEAIKNEAREIPAMDPGPLRDERFTDVTSQILFDWRGDRRNLSPSWRTFFGGGLSNETESFFRKGIDGATTAIGAGVIGDTTYHAVVGQFEEALFVAAGSLIVGLATKAVGARRRRLDEQSRSPYRYLTLLEQNGVVFRGAEHEHAVG